VAAGTAARTAAAAAAAQIVAGPDDTLVALAARPLPTRHDPLRRVTYWVAVHRRFGTWTHLYAVVESSQAHSRGVHLLAALPGERVAEAAARLPTAAPTGGMPEAEAAD
jgi:hypothetical protein